MILNMSILDKVALRRLAMWLSMICFSLLVIQQAWMADDSFLTLRVIKNWHEGYGIRWNIADRVQVYSHPLWMFLLGFVTFITQEYIYTTLVLSTIIAIMAFGLLWKIANNPTIALVGSLILYGSHSFIAYATSGLENALSYVLIAVLIYVILTYQTRQWYPLWLGLLTSLLLLNRLDLSILIAPIITSELWSKRSRNMILFFLVGLIPFILWESFSLIYYGVPLPHVMYATTYEPLFINGLRYFLFSLRYDAVTLVAIALGLIAGFYTRQRIETCLSIGVMLYLGYWIYRGGDTFGGRAFSVSVWVAILIVVQAIKADSAKYIWSSGLMILGVFIINTLLDIQNPVTSDYVTTRPAVSKEYALSLIHTSNQANQPVTVLTTIPIRAIGVVGFYAGPQVHIIDSVGLTDALIARLPPLYNPYPHSYYAERALPDGYVTTKATGMNTLTDPLLAEYYTSIATLTQDHLWSWQRWKAIWNINTGGDADLIDQHRYTFYNLVALTEEAAKTVTEPIQTRGINVTFNSVQTAEYLQLKLDSRSAWQIIWNNGSTSVAKHTIDLDRYPHNQIYTHQIATPIEAQTQGYDSIYVIARSAESITHDTPEFFGFQQLLTTSTLADLEPRFTLSAGWISKEAEQVSGQVNFVPDPYMQVFIPVHQTVQLKFTPDQIWKHPLKDTTTTQTGSVRLQVLNTHIDITVPITQNQTCIVELDLPSGIHAIKLSFDNDPEMYRTIVVDFNEHYYTRVLFSDISIETK